MLKKDSGVAPADKGEACLVRLTPEQAETRGLAWVIGAFLFCPCHLPLTLGLAATLLAGTAAGALLRGHPLIAGTVITAVWVAGTWRGLRYFRSARKYAQTAMPLNLRGRNSEDTYVS